ncbi:MAG: hypothetical protein AAF823_15290 [Planctomycetota bacterium]
MSEDQTYRGPERRESVVDTRTDQEREDTGLERRRGPGRRRSDFAKSAEEGEMSPEQFLFIKAIDTYKRVNQRPYPTWTEVLEVVRKLGYRKTTACQIDIPSCEDWLEDPNAPAFVEPTTPFPESPDAKAA